MAARVDNQRASSSVSSGIYKYCGDPGELSFRLIIEENSRENDLRIDLSRSKVSYGENESIISSPLSASTNESFYQETDLKSINNASLSDPRVEYIIKWKTTHPTVEKLQTNLEKNNSNEQNGCCSMTQNYRIVAKIVYDKNHLPPYKKTNCTLHQQVKWNDMSVMMLSNSSRYHDVMSSKLYNHYHNSTISDNDTKTYTGDLVNNNIITRDNINQSSTDNLNKSITMCIVLERIQNSTTFVDMANSPSSAPVGSCSDLIAQPSTSTQNFDNNTLSYIDTLGPHQHVLGLITVDEQSRLIIIKPDLGTHLDFNRSSNLHSLPRFTYWFRLITMDDHDKALHSLMDVINPMEAKINLTRNLFRPQLNQNNRPTTRSKKVFSFPINGSLITYIQLNIQHAHSILPGKIKNLYVRYRLFSQLSMGGESLETQVNTSKSSSANMNDKKLNCKFQNLHLDGTTVTSLASSIGMFHFSCIEQLSIESKKTMQDQQLNLLMEFYSSDFYRKRLEGWAFVTLPRSNPRKIVEVDIIHYDLYRLVDRLRYHLLGTLPDDMIDVEKIVLSQNRYLLPTRFVGRLVLDYEAFQQVSDPSLDKATIELLKITDAGTRMLKIDIESVIQAYKLARKKLEALEC